MLAGQSACLRTRLVLAQNRGDLLFHKQLYVMCPSLNKDWAQARMEEVFRGRSGELPHQERQILCPPVNAMALTLWPGIVESCMDGPK